MIGLNDFKRLIAPIKTKIFLSLGRGILKAINNTEGTQKIQVVALKDEIINNMERFQEYGFETYPLADSQVAAIFLNGNRDHGLALCVHDRDQRPQDLVEGEVCVYGKDDVTTPFRLHFKDGGILNIKAATLDIDVSGNTTEDVTSTKTITANSVVINAATVYLGGASGSGKFLVHEDAQVLYDAHTHAGGGAGVPNVPWTNAVLTTKVKAT